MYNARSARGLGFPYLDLGREYAPVALKIKMPKIQIGRDRLGREVLTFGPFKNWTETWLIAAEVDYRVREFFIMHPQNRVVLRFRPDTISVLFDALSFFYIMQYASRGNKLMFFRRAVVEDQKEVEQFLNLVEDSDLSDKDKRRAKTWIYRRIKNLDI